MDKHQKTAKKLFSGKGFYIILAMCLVAVGAAGFLAVSPIKANDKNKTSEQSGSSEYTDPGITYNSNTKPEEPAQNIVSDEPYSSETKPTESTVPAAPTAEFFNMPVKEGQIVKKYDDKTLQYSETYGDLRIHLGTDILADNGCDILSCGDGTVKKVYSDDKLGRVVEIDHGNGIVVKYCGFADDICVKEDSKVTVGQKIGTLSGVPSESADAPHLHIEVTKSGKSVDPVKTLKLS